MTKTLGDVTTIVIYEGDNHIAYGFYCSQCGYDSGRVAQKIEKCPKCNLVSTSEISVISDDILEAVINEHDMNVPDDLLAAPTGFGAHREAMKAALQKIIPLTLHIEAEYKKATKRKASKYNAWSKPRHSYDRKGDYSCTKCGDPWPHGKKGYRKRPCPGKRNEIEGQKL